MRLLNPGRMCQRGHGATSFAADSHGFSRIPRSKAKIAREGECARRKRARGGLLSNGTPLRPLFLSVDSRRTVTITLGCESSGGGLHPILKGMDKTHFFFERYGLTKEDVERYLAAALSAGGDYADLYFEYLTSTGITLDESMVKSATQGVAAGCGERVIAVERTGYSCTDGLAPQY